MSTQEDRSAAIAVAAFPAFILLGSVLAFVAPGPFLPLTSFITYFLMIIMFGMGLTLTIPDFKGWRSGPSRSPLASSRSS